MMPDSYGFAPPSAMTPERLPDLGPGSSVLARRSVRLPAPGLPATTRALFPPALRGRTAKPGWAWRAPAAARLHRLGWRRLVRCRLDLPARNSSGRLSGRTVTIGRPRRPDLLHERGEHPADMRAGLHLPVPDAQLVDERSQIRPTASVLEGPFRTEVPELIA